MRFGFSISLAAVLGLSAGSAHADERAAEPASLDWHVILAGSAGVMVPTGKLEAGLPIRNETGPGPAFGFELGFGFATRLTAGLWGQYAHLGSGNVCTACSASTLGAGPFLGFHLDPGGRFDPWATIGLGYRATSIGTSADAEQITWSGFEPLRVQVGGDWYGFQKSALGAYLELDAGAATRKTPGDLGSPATHYLLLAGVRFAFDTFGRDTW